MSKVVSYAGKFRQTTVLLIFLVFCVIMTFASQHFLTWGNFSTTLLGMSTAVLLVIAQTVVMASGGIDLAVGANMALSSTVMAYLFVNNDGISIWPAALIGLVAVALNGLINGIILSRTTIAPMICTLGTMSLAAGIAMILTGGSPISIGIMPDSFRFIGNGRIFDTIPLLILIALVFVIIFSLLLYKSTIFRRVYYVGSNAQSAEYSGINVKRVKLGCYVLSALLSGLAGIMVASRFSVASANAGAGMEMTIIAACVIGGSSMKGGTGTVVGSLLGLMLLTFINNALVLLHISVFWQNFISGCILLIAVLIDYFSQNAKNKTKNKMKEGLTT